MLDREVFVNYLRANKWVKVTYVKYPKDVIVLRYGRKDHPRGWIILPLSKKYADYESGLMRAFYEVARIRKENIILTWEDIKAYEKIQKTRT